MVIAHTSKPLSNECPLCHTDTMVLAKLPDTSMVIACTSCGVCSEPFPCHPHAQESWKHIRSYLRKKPTPDPELDSYTLYYGEFRTCSARFVKYDRPMTCDLEALDYARDFMRENGLFVVGVSKNLHPWGDLRHVAFVCDTDQIEVKCRASFDPWDTGYHYPRKKRMGPSFNRKAEHPERDVVLEKLAADLHYASYDMDTYEYLDQYGPYPSEQGRRDAFDLLMSVEGLDTAIEFIEDGMETGEYDYGDLLDRLKARRDELTAVGSASRKSKRYGKPAKKRAFGLRRNA